ncbi:hypothetical protein A3B21_01600 [Candidatus Uhrbacteria bacterium RIFCSPLOWO2_01_FULL_47_24]|uniref:DUF3108 domain-containing protein n=1 Tax=Candidatus Uhrbacteria bacterium RIFCSPLOWO2_01_FULL_47_24 TaxID=1802401 RepID=A0A1F7URZ6_9BACT|nr:MAG: hypothetical protein A2753_04700 [Candidatus Uhrbacteria bacterium RIFCSPHIGHO2_01_FULL_47_11]OGL68677.1 MAG: hypothetical protein A3D58_02090 [Candidatus Uhrbacteria bacterium RIFCSPHIGHO2_02_FULL_46_47]OGL81073.1 MAG: hypothetical protein A3B21_01600 [Candidatus Uhrbacteria bacterium RIFCSPLOWO2_01_FULL_47_24]OGL84592.1 MAG: hypothetical protein A3J03_02195 [Candidatus Uhrbacteria bacterium RIFCSPLOWO2_02_FULL_46_25]OGL93007.1 MAG: hypothetical protein A3H11_03165 [Candidatus Uhrbacte
MKKRISLVVLAMGVLLLVGAGCGKQTQKSASPGSPLATPPEQEESSIKMGKLYNLGALREYEYRITSGADSQQGAMNVKYTISSDTVNGKAAWLQQSDMDVQGNKVSAKMWMSKSSMACLKVLTVMNIAGQTMSQDGQCPEEGPNAATATGEEELKYIGKESVTVPAGTFNAKKYEQAGATFWAVDNIPVPLKVSYTGADSTVMELVSYK